MKLHIRTMPMELRYFGDLYVKQEFRLHLDKATEDQMDKFMVAWEQYAKQIEQVKSPTTREVKKKILENSEFDEIVKEKMNQE